MAIIIAAPIGAGKSTVTTVLSELMGVPAVYESVSDNPVLPLYYKDRKRYGFHLQMYFLQRRVADMKNIYTIESTTHQHIVSDRSIIEDLEIFATQLHETGMIDDVEFDIYQKNITTDLDLLKSYKNLTNGTSQDLLIYLAPSFDRTLHQIQTRGRNFEQVSENKELIDYYRDIYSRYDDWYENYNDTPKIKIESYDVSDEQGRYKFLKDVVEKASEIGFSITIPPETKLSMDNSFLMSKKERNQLTQQLFESSKDYRKENHLVKEDVTPAFIEMLCESYGLSKAFSEKDIDAIIQLYKNLMHQEKLNQYRMFGELSNLLAIDLSDCASSKELSAYNDGVIRYKSDTIPPNVKSHILKGNQ